jgi:hypothetical protein
VNRCASSPLAPLNLPDLPDLFVDSSPQALRSDGQSVGFYWSPV